MALKVVHVGDINGSQVVVTVESKDLEEVLSAPAKTLAIKAAARVGLIRGGIDTMSGAYPVDSEGRFEPNPEKWPETAKVGGFSYRNKITVRSASVI